MTPGTADESAPTPRLALVLAELVARLGSAIVEPGVTVEAVADRVGTSPQDQGGPLEVRAEVPVDGVAELTVTRQWDTDAPNAATLHLDEPIALVELEGELGPSHMAPVTPAGARRAVFSTDDADGWTVLGHVDDHGDVAAVTVRPS